MRDFVAGVFGGMCGVVAGQPLDFVRVRLQTASHTIESPLMLLRSAIRTEGIRAVWKGMTSPIFGVSFQNAITFVSYGQAMHMLSSEKKIAHRALCWMSGLLERLPDFVNLSWFVP
jgi:solute carrier family 25 (mitochondrial carnitine/acylcarnitine transporter), member 20/29